MSTNAQNDFDNAIMLLFIPLVLHICFCQIFVVVIGPCQHYNSTPRINVKCSRRVPQKFNLVGDMTF